MKFLNWYMSDWRGVELFSRFYMVRVLAISYSLYILWSIFSGEKLSIFWPEEVNYFRPYWSFSRTQRPWNYIKKYNLDKIWVILYGPKFILHPHIPLLLFGISLWKLCHFYFNDNRGESQMIVTLLVLWRLRYSLQRVEPVEELPVELLDKNLMATWTIVHLASELVDLPWDSSVVSLAASPSAPRDALLVR